MKTRYVIYCLSSLFGQRTGRYNADILKTSLEWTSNIKEAMQYIEEKDAFRRIQHELTKKGSDEDFVYEIKTIYTN